jgi:nitrogen fixation NifU-like protein
VEFVDPDFLDHFMNPRNVGTIEDPDGIGMGGDPSCGDWLIITLRIKDEVISGIRFQCRGCSSAIATSSATTELAEGRTLGEAMEITAAMIEDAVGGLAEDKKHCSLLGEKALRSAIEDYKSRKA